MASGGGGRQDGDPPHICHRIQLCCAVIWLIVWRHHGQSTTVDDRMLLVVVLTINDRSILYALISDVGYFQFGEQFISSKNRHP